MLVYMLVWFEKDFSSENFLYSYTLAICVSHVFESRKRHHLFNDLIEHSGEAASCWKHRFRLVRALVS